MWRDMAELPVECRMSATRPDYRPAAPRLAEEIRKWFEDPEHEREYQEWKKAKESA